MSQYPIQQTPRNASAVAVSPVNADVILTAGITLNSSLWAGVGVFNRGKPFTVLTINKSNLLDVLGEPLKPSAGLQFIMRCRLVRKLSWIVASYSVFILTMATRARPDPRTFFRTY